MATVSYFTADLPAACAWYTEVTGVEPYFRRDGYAEWRIGDHQAELGLIATSISDTAGEASARAGQEGDEETGPRAGQEDQKETGPRTSQEDEKETGPRTSQEDEKETGPRTSQEEAEEADQRAGQAKARPTTGEPAATTAATAIHTTTATQTATATGAILYWHTDNVQATLTRLLALGATVHEPLQHRGRNFITAIVQDPFGNLLGIMHNPHYLEMLAKA
ncbi:VOC family protein [Dactylosporangium sp. NPDC051541]|uniref:VOC family protein n=1 Tax=Dactylosporangium sp. NPDC051541 TaxID=3363977 RepID=UPI0037A17810